MPRAVLGVAVQRQVGQDQAESMGEVLDDRLELPVREPSAVQQHEAGPDTRLAVRDAGAVGGVEQAEAQRRHPDRSPARRPSASAATDAGSATSAPVRSRRCVSSALVPDEPSIPRRAAPMR